MKHLFWVCALLLAMEGCNPVASTSIGTEFHPGVSLSVSKATVTASNTEVSVDSKIDVFVSLFDENGAPFTSNTVKIAATTSGGTSVGNFSSFVSNNDGTYTASFTGVTAGTTTTMAITVDDTVVTGTMPQVIVTSSDFSLTESQLTVSASSITAKAEATVTLIAKNPYGHQLEQGGLTVELSNAGGTSAGFFSSVTDHRDGSYTATFTGVTAGTATTLRAKINGNFVTSTRPTLTVTGTSPFSFTGVSGKNQSITVARTVTLPFVVLVKDSSSNPLQGITIDWAVISGSGTLSSSTGLSDAGGNAQTTLTLGTVSGDVRVRATVRGASPELTTDFVTTAVADAAATIVISQQPTSSSAGSALSPTITVSAVDIYGNVDKTFTNNIVATILTNPGGATLSGTTTQAAIQGVSYFNDLSLNKTGAGYRLAFASGGFTTVNSSTFNVRAGAISTANSTFAVSASSLVKGGISTLTMTAKDAYNNSITTGGLTVTFTRFAGAGESVGTISATTDHNDGTYTATYTATSKGTLNTLAVLVGGGPGYLVQQATITVNNSAPTLTAISTLPGADENVAFSITYATLAAAADEADLDSDAISFRVEAVSAGTLTKGGVAVTPTVTTLGAGETLVWTGLSGSIGTVNAFTVKASDGTTVSSTAIQVKATVTHVNQAPTISDILDTSTNEDVAKVVNFTIGDTDSTIACNSTYLSMSSSATSVIANASVVWGGTFPNCTATITPTANKFGTPTITVTVSDGSRSSNDTFVLTVVELGDEAQSMDFPFTALTDSSYTFDPAKIDLTGGVAELSVVSQQDNSSVLFDQGTYTGGASYDTTNSYIRLSTSSPNLELDSSWAPAWNNLVSYWKLNEAAVAATVSDSAPGGSGTGSVVGGVTLNSSGKIGTAAVFDGSSGYVNIPTSTNYNITAGSVGFWIKATTPASGVLRHIISRCDSGISLNGWLLYLDSAGNLGGSIKGVSEGAAFYGPTVTGVTDGNWHYVVFEFSQTVGGQNLFYVDGKAGTSVTTPGAWHFNGQATRMGIALDGFWQKFNGSLDEVSIWNTQLSADAVKAIYDHQMSKYTGTLTSRVMDAISTGHTWPTFAWIPTLPYYKALPNAGSSELAADYSSQTASLMNGIVGLWHLDEAAGTTGAGSILDKSGLGVPNNATPNRGLTFGGPGRIGSSVKIGTDGYISIPYSTSLNLTRYTYSLWVNVPFSLSADVSLISRRGIGSWTQDNFGAGISSSNGTISAGHVAVSTAIQSVIGTHDIRGRGWTHFLGSYDGTNITVYLNGKLEGSTPATDPSTSAGSPVIGIGRDPFNGDSNLFPGGGIDEVAIWNRALSTGEILEVYRRGANRIKYQVRSCSDSACTTGSPPWLGPDGTNQSYFSELYNTASNSFTGAVAAGLPTMTFANFGAPLTTNLIANRYFQYRAIMESDDANTLCNYGSGATACSPEIKSVSAGTGGSNYATDATISNAVVMDATSLSAFANTIGATNGCSSGVTYNLKIGSGSWYWWNAAKASDCTTAGAGAWCAADGTTAKSNSAATINSHVATLYSQTAQVGGLYFKAFLNSDGTTKCELDNVHIDGTQ